VKTVLKFLFPVQLGSTTLEARGLISGTGNGFFSSAQRRDRQWALTTTLMFFLSPWFTVMDDE